MHSVVNIKLTKAVFNMPAASYYIFNRSQSFPELSYCLISQIFADLFTTRYQNFFQMLHAQNLLTVKRLL